MNLAKDHAIAAISRAHAELNTALEQIEHLPAFDLGTVGFAAHALNNYLTVINGTAQMLQEALQNCGEDEVLRWLQALTHTSELMTHTVHQLMSMSASASEAFKFREMDLPTLVERACTYYRRIAERKQIAIVFQNLATSSQVWADPVAVAAALDNLLSNAVKYSPRFKTVHVEVQSEPEHLVCRVRDEGPGIDPAERERLFQKGVRLSTRPTGDEPSTGFGLAVAKELVTKIGGEIWHEAPSEGGACFAFRLPLERKA